MNYRIDLPFYMFAHDKRLAWIFFNIGFCSILQVALENDLKCGFTLDDDDDPLVVSYYFLDRSDYMRFILLND